MTPQKLPALAAFARCERGVIAVTFAILFLPIAMILLLLIDLVAIEQARSGYRAALDHTVSASERRRDLSGRDLERFARQTFDGRLGETLSRQVSAFEFVRDGNGVRAAAGGTIVPSFQRLFGRGEVPVSATASLTY